MKSVDKARVAAILKSSRGFRAGGREGRWFPVSSGLVTGTSEWPQLMVMGVALARARVEFWLHRQPEGRWTFLVHEDDLYVGSAAMHYFEAGFAETLNALPEPFSERPRKGSRRKSRRKRKRG